MLLKNQWINDDIKEEFRKNLETNENENTTFHNLWDAAKAGLRGKLLVLQAFLKKQGKSQVNNLTYRQKNIIWNRKTNKAQSQQKEGNNKNQRGNK